MNAMNRAAQPGHWAAESATTIARVHLSDHYAQGVEQMRESLDSTDSALA